MLYFLYKLRPNLLNCAAYHKIRSLIHFVAADNVKMDLKFVVGSLRVRLSERWVVSSTVEQSFALKPTL